MQEALKAVAFGPCVYIFYESIGAPHITINSLMAFLQVLLFFLIALLLFLRYCKGKSTKRRGARFLAWAIVLMLVVPVYDLLHAPPPPQGVATIYQHLQQCLVSSVVFVPLIMGWMSMQPTIDPEEQRKPSSGQFQVVLSQDGAAATARILASSDADSAEEATGALAVRGSDQVSFVAFQSAHEEPWGELQPGGSAFAVEKAKGPVYLFAWSGGAIGQLHRIPWEEEKEEGRPEQLPWVVLFLALGFLLHMAKEVWIMWSDGGKGAPCFFPSGHCNVSRFNHLFVIIPDGFMDVNGTFTDCSASSDAAFGYIGVAISSLCFFQVLLMSKVALEQLRIYTAALRRLTDSVQAYQWSGGGSLIDRQVRFLRFMHPIRATVGIDTIFYQQHKLSNYPLVPPAQVSRGLAEEGEPPEVLWWGWWFRARCGLIQSLDNFYWTVLPALMFLAVQMLMLVAKLVYWLVAERSLQNEEAINVIFTGLVCGPFFILALLRASDVNKEIVKSLDAVEGALQTETDREYFRWAKTHLYQLKIFGVPLGSKLFYGSFGTVSTTVVAAVLGSGQQLLTKIPFFASLLPSSSA